MSGGARATTSRRYWTEQEDYILQNEALSQIAEKGMVNDWSTIASKLKGSRTNKDCRKRWTKIGSSGNKGQWTAEEDDRLRRSVAEHGHCWSLVAQMVQTRHADQCAKRWLHFLDPNLSHERWSDDEDKKLLDAVQAYGTSWKMIGKKTFPNRSSTDLKNRYVILSRRQKNTRDNSVSEPGPSDDEDVPMMRPMSKGNYTPSSSSHEYESQLPDSQHDIAGTADANFMFSFQQPISPQASYAPFSSAADITDNTSDMIAHDFSKFDNVMNLEPGFEDCFLEAGLSSINHHEGSGSSGLQNVLTSVDESITTDLPSSRSHSHAHSHLANGMALNVDGDYDQDDTRYTLVLEDVTGDNLQKLTNQLFKYQMPVKMRITSTGS